MAPWEGRTHGRGSEVEEGVFGGEDEVQAGKDRDKGELTLFFFFHYRIISKLPKGPSH